MRIYDLKNMQYSILKVISESVSLIYHPPIVLFIYWYVHSLIYSLVGLTVEAVLLPQLCYGQTKITVAPFTNMV